MNLQIKVTGDKELIRKMQGLSKRMATSIQRKAVRAGSTPMLKAFRAAAPVGETGRLRRAQTRKFKTYRNSGTSIAVVGADYSIGPHAHLVERGTVDRYRKKFASFPKRGFTGRVTGLRVFEKAFNGAAGTSKSVIETTFRAELNKAIA